MSGQLNIEKTANKLFLDTCQFSTSIPNDLSVAQRLRVNRASVLRLQIDDLEAAHCAASNSTSQLIEASEALERLVGGNPEAAATHNFAGAREELVRFFAERAERIEFCEAQRKYAAA